MQCQSEKIHIQIGETRSIPEVIIHDHVKQVIPGNTFYRCQVFAARNYRNDTLAFLLKNINSDKKSEKDEKHSEKFRASNIDAYDSMKRIPTFRLFNVCVPYWF